MLPSNKIAQNDGINFKINIVNEFLSFTTYVYGLIHLCVADELNQAQ